MIYNRLKRGKSQIMFRFLPGAVFLEDKRWYKVDDLDLSKISEDTTHLLHQVKKLISGWQANAGLPNNLYPSQDELYFFGEIQQVIYNLFPYVFYCEVCNNTHEYFKLEEIQKNNPELKCKFCNKGYLKQYSYALIHPNGDIQSIKVKTNAGAKSWKDKYDGIKMNDTRRFTTATWYNSKKNIPLGFLGTKNTNLPLTEEMVNENNRFLGGTHLSDGDIYYPVIRSIVNLKQDTLLERQRHTDFPYVQFAALLGLPSINRRCFSDNFIVQNNDNPLIILLNNTQDEIQKEMLLKMIKESSLENKLNIKTFKDEIEPYLCEFFDTEKVINDRLLHEFVFSWYETNGKTLEDKIAEARETNDSLQETTLLNAKKEVINLGFDTIMLLEKFPIVTLGIGFTRKFFDRKKAVLNPFYKTINNKKYTVIPVLKNENEAIIFKLDPLRIFAWLHINALIESTIIPKNKEQAHSYLYQVLKLGEIDVEDLAQIDITSIENDNILFATILTFQLVHTQIHMLLNAGKSVLGLDVDSMSEYIFPSSLSGAIYVSKLQGGGMGTLIAAFDNDLERWLRNTYDKTQICMYDPICKGQHGACHACSYLKFSCQHFNRGLSRNLLVGGFVGDRLIKGYQSKEVDDYLIENAK